ncbi:MFS transporter [Pallidibacillus thermolactis]|jgi:MFS transporter, PPP family, 3-phenylpropionic acid transporter|uniref:MFS transporter n=1 Tax=Pallidibacillus thermolactis TaxID=251051 RepID=UPI0021D868D5|nr:MFS transporter [Pallidibacillus thermolactis]MCU9601469.1 MFS transporter [Pallidibacillus thermolactis subsp. kokeshiiformis]
MKNQQWLSLNFFSFFITWGIFLPYWTGWLTNEKNLSVGMASIVIGAGMMSRSISNLFLYPIFTIKFSLSVVMKWISILSIIILFLYIPSETFLPLFIITIIFNAIYPNFLPAIESSATILVATDHINYGKSRAYGSIGYAVGLIIVGTFTSLFTDAAIFWIMCIGLLFMAFTMYQKTPDIIQTKPNFTTQKVEYDSILKLLTSSRFLIVLIISILLQGAHTSYYNYGFIYLQEIGVNSFYIGIILNLAILLEIIFFAIADRYFQHLKVSTMYIVASVGSSIRWLIIFLFPNVHIFMISQTLHVVSFGIAHYAFIKFISENLETNQISTAQGLYSAFGMSLINAVLSFGTGFLYEISPQLAFLGMIACTIPALVLTMSTMKRYQY